MTLDWFWGSTRREGECLLWTGWVAKRTGYGLLAGRGRNHKPLAHRTAWELTNAREVPAGMLVCHHCDVRACIEPTHLFLGTTRDNSDDMLRKCRSGGDSRILEIDGERQPAAVWARRYGLARHTLIARLRKGWPPALAVKTPVIRLAGLMRAAIEKEALDREEP